MRKTISTPERNPDALDFEVDHILADGMSQARLGDLRRLCRLGPAAPGALRLPVVDDRQFRRLCRVTHTMFERFAVPLRQMAKWLRDSDPEEWIVFAPPPCGPDRRVFYKVHVKPPGQVWHHCEQEISALGKRNLPYLYERESQLTEAEWRRMRRRDVEGGLELFARYTSDAPDKHGLYAMCRLAKTRLAMAGHTYVEPLR